MLVLSVVLLAIVIPGVSAGLVAYRSTRRDPAAPALSVPAMAQSAPRDGVLDKVTKSPATREATTGLGLGIAILVVVVGLAVVGVLLIMIHTNTGFAKFDRGASLFGAHHATKLSTHVLKIFTQIGGALVVVPLALIVGVVETMRQRTPAVFGFLVVVVGGQFLAANLTKSVVGRARPHFDQLTGFSGSSFPSGHAVASAACFAAFALVIGRRRSRRVRAVLAGLAIGLATGIACTRVMLGVHWLTDVLAGLALGWAWFALSSIAFGGRRLRFAAPAIDVHRAIEPEGA